MRFYITNKKEIIIVYMLSLIHILAYGPEPDNSGRNASKGVDCSGKDLVRACFLNYDPDALFRNIINSQSIKK